MQICCCSLAGTKACDSCLSNKLKNDYRDKNYIDWFNTSNYKGILDKDYNYEIPDWKSVSVNTGDSNGR